MHEGQEDRKPSRKRKPSPRARALAVRWIEPDRFPLAVPRPFLHSGIVVYCAGARRWHMVLAAVAERPAIGTRFDPLDAAYLDDPYPYLAEAREAAPVFCRPVRGRSSSGSARRST
jgi:hypothetical protein